MALLANLNVTDDQYARTVLETNKHPTHPVLLPFSAAECHIDGHCNLRRLTQERPLVRLYAG